MGIELEDRLASPDVRYEQRESVELAFVASLQHLPIYGRRGRRQDPLPPQRLHPSVRQFHPLRSLYDDGVPVCRPTCLLRPPLGARFDIQRRKHDPPASNRRRPCAPLPGALAAGGPLGLIVIADAVRGGQDGAALWPHVMSDEDRSMHWTDRLHFAT